MSTAGCSDHGVPRFLEDGTFVGYIGSIVDIHDRKLAEEKIRFQVQVMQDVSEGIISTDLGLNIISFNKAAENIYGIPGNETIGRRLNEIINPIYLSNTWEDVLQEVHKKGCWEGHAYYNRHDGKTHLPQLCIIICKERTRYPALVLPAYSGILPTPVNRRKTCASMRKDTAR